MASSGIDYDIKLWMPLEENPHFEEERAAEASIIFFICKAQEKLYKFDILILKSKICADIVNFHMSCVD